MTNPRILTGLLLAALAGMSVTYLIDTLRGDEWEPIKALLISSGVAVIVFLGGRYRAGARADG